ncbi:hypothetical protein HOP50_10g60640 [Chloropicon primus]|uniref:Uncharacterized protein n=1 Tax=Chloropicon primus TaxID=1764295 RepID=A0A5B8MV61_9CHLO|nr:hypothetical protein A3770_10p60430 [Chloropicon primus]UPR02737.1 hypothetical protein HOP50_10g60640 [Chloropicon primus]|eukprot:QDZ23525.1 hypothetical protein A3770_10p60430 [Chloropicon primus]
MKAKGPLVPGGPSTAARRLDLDLGETCSDSRKLNGMISENIDLLRRLFGDTMESLYQEEFGKRYREDEAGPANNAWELGAAKAKVLGDRVGELRRQLEAKQRETEELKATYERREREARANEYRYGALCSDFAQNPDHKMEHLTLMDKFNDLSSAVRQANETNEDLKAKIALREQVLQDADRINSVVGTLEEEEPSTSVGAGGGGGIVGAPHHSPSKRASSSSLSSSLSSKGKDGEEFYFYADSAATALEMERLRLMMRNVGKRLQEAEEERQTVSKATAMLNMQLDRAEQAKRKVLVEIALAQKNDSVPPAKAGGGPGGSNYLEIPDLDAMKAEADKREEVRMEALRAQLAKRQQQREDAVRKAKELKESLRLEQEKRAKEAEQLKRAEEEKQKELWREREKREEEIKRHEKMEKDLREKDKEVRRLKEQRIKELQGGGFGHDDHAKEEVLRTFVESLSPEKDVLLSTPERERTLVSVSPDSDFAFPATVHKEQLDTASSKRTGSEYFSAEVASSVPSSAYQSVRRRSGSATGTPMSEIHIEGIQTDLANRILSKTDGMMGDSPSFSGSPRQETPSKRLKLKVSPITRMRVPKSLTQDEILARLEEIELRRSSAFESLSTKDVHLIAEEELEEKVLRRRLKKLQRRER